MIRNIPCNIITGPLGAGKSTAILHLLATHSDGNWAVLVNEMGDVGIDGALARSGLTPRGALDETRHESTRVVLQAAAAASPRWPAAASAAPTASPPR